MRKILIALLWLASFDADAQTLRSRRTPAIRASAIGYVNSHALLLSSTNINFGDVATDGATRMVASAWVGNANCNGDETLWGKWLASGTSREWGARMLAGPNTCRLVIYISPDGSSNANWTSATEAFLDNAWAHVCFSFDGSAGTNATRLRTYFDGVEATGAGVFAGSAVPAAIRTGTQPLYLGLFSGTFTMTSSVDDLALWIGGNPPSCTEIYNARRLVDLTTFNPPPTHCWDFNGDTLPTIRDRCGTAHGTASGSPSLHTAVAP